VCDFRKYDAIETLKIVNTWTNNVDTKVGLTLGGFVVFSGFLINSDIAISIVSKAVKQPMSCGDYVYMGLFVLSLLFLLVGIAYLFLVFSPRIKLKSDNDGNAKHNNIKSVMFFGIIANRYNKFSEYKKEATSINKEDLMEDILQQIFEASKICAKKFEHQRRGLKISLVGYAAFFICLLIGVFRYS